MRSRHLLSLLLVALGLIGCSSQKLIQEVPFTPQTGSGKNPRWIVAYPGSHASALAPLIDKRERQGYEVVRISNAKPEDIRKHVDSRNLGVRKGDCMLIVGNTATIPSAK